MNRGEKRIRKDSAYNLAQHYIFLNRMTFASRMASFAFFNLLRSGLIGPLRENNLLSICQFDRFHNSSVVPKVFRLGSLKTTTNTPTFQKSYNYRNHIVFRLASH